VIELSYYSNSVVTHYALESVIALAITRSLSSGCTVMTHDNLLENATELCSIFQYEFLFNKPCQNLEQILTSCIDDLSVKGVFLAVSIVCPRASGSDVIIVFPFLLHVS